MRFLLTNGKVFDTTSARRCYECRYLTTIEKTIPRSTGDSQKMDWLYQSQSGEWILVVPRRPYRNTYVASIVSPLKAAVWLTVNGYSLPEDLEVYVNDVFI